MSRLALWPVRFLIVIVAISVPALILEVSLRMLGPFLPGNYYSGDVYLEPHPIFGRFHVPNSSGWLRTEEYTTRVDINSHGLRDRDIPYEKPVDVRRVVVVGDSFVEGEEVSADAMLTRRLTAYLKTPGAPRTQVINGGVRAFGTAQEYLFLKHEALRYQPDVVVFAFYSGNDVADNNPRVVHSVASRHRPYFDLDKHGQLSALPFRPQRTAALGVVDQLKRASLLFSVIDTGVLQKLNTNDEASADAPDEENDNEAAQPDRRMVKYELPVFSDATSRNWENAWDVTEALLVASRDEAARAGASFVLVNIPTKWELYPKDWSDLLDRNSLPDDGWDLNGPSDRMGGIAAEHDIPYVDLRTTFQQQVDSDERLYYQTDIHWTPRGHDIAAQRLAEVLKAVQPEVAKPSPYSG